MGTRVIFRVIDPGTGERNDVAMVEWKGESYKITMIRGQDLKLYPWIESSWNGEEMVGPKDKAKYLDLVRRKFAGPMSTFVGAEIIE